MRSLADLRSLDGRVVVVTGGAGHVGGAICDACEVLGGEIAILDRDQEACDAAVGTSQRRHGFPVDLRDPEAIRAVMRRVETDLDRLDAVVHCAAYVGTTGVPGWAVPFEDQTVDAWDEALRVNLTAAFVLAQAARPALAASGNGTMVFVSSIYGMVGPDMRLYDDTDMNNPAGYAASKGGLNQLTRHLATLFAPEIRVNTLTLGGVWRKQPEAFVERYERRTPMRRMATEEDFKGAAAFLLSDLSAYVTGQNIVVDGGWTAW